jgi:hypothetical protein
LIQKEIEILINDITGVSYNFQCQEQMTNASDISSLEKLDNLAKFVRVLVSPLCLND